jgi:hypothetical protein
MGKNAKTTVALAKKLKIFVNGKMESAYTVVRKPIEDNFASHVICAKMKVKFVTR